MTRGRRGGRRIARASLRGAAAGLPGGVVYFATMGPQGALTRAGITPSPLLQPMSEAAIPAGAHVAYGVATVATLESLG